MKLVHKLLIGISSVVVAAGIATAIGVSVSANGDGTKHAGIIYNSTQQQKEKIEPKPKEEKPKEEKPEETPKQPEPQQEEVQPEQLPEPKPEETLPQPVPAPEEEGPILPDLRENPSTSETPGVVEREITLDDNKTKIILLERPQPPRFISQYDKDNGLANLQPYKNLHVADQIGIKTVTKEFIDYNIKKFQEGFKVNNITDSLKKSVIQFENNPEELNKFLQQNQSNWNLLFERFRALFENGDKVKEFLTPEGVQKYDEIKKIENRNARYALLISYLDPNKFNKLTIDAQKQLKQGFILEPREIIVNAEGEVDSRAYSPFNNTVTSRLEYDNENLRVFGSKTFYNRTSQHLANGDYVGWKKTDATSNYTTRYNFQANQGIKFFELKREKEEAGKRNTGLIVEFDVKRPTAYKEAVRLINDLKAKNEQVTGYRFRNIGDGDANQRFKHILEVLPQKLNLLELYFEKTDTSAMLALENKEIDELGLYTTGNSLLEDWSINPHSLKKVKYVNTNDYNVSFEYEKNKRIGTRITFDAISFDQSDYKQDGATEWDRFKRLNDGLRMVYFTRNNEPFFQGGFGPGLSPDQNEKNNSYPLGLDLGRVKNLKSLRGLVFKDLVKPANGERKLRRLNLFNDKDLFEIDTNELNQAQFNVLDSDPRIEPPTKITFTNGEATKNVYVKQGNKQLTETGIQNLRWLLHYGKKNFQFKPIYVTKGDTHTFELLKSRGLDVKYYDEENAFIPT